MKKLITMMLMLASVFFFACEDDDSDQLSKEEAVAELQNLDGDMSGYMEEMVNSEGMEAIDVLMNLPDPFTSGNKSLESNSLIPTLKKYLLPVNPEKTKFALEYGNFDFNAYKGYEYVYTTAPFEHFAINEIDDPYVVIKFPTEGSTTNDAVLTIYDYAEVMITDMYSEWYNPTDLDADLTVDEVKVIDIDLQSTWVTSGDAAGDPSSFDISVYLFPFEFTGDFDHTSTAANIDFGINYIDGESTVSIFSAGVDATFEDNDLDNPLTVGGYVQLLLVKVEANVDVKGIETIFEDIEAGTSSYTTMEELTKAINDEIDAVVKVDGVKAADIEILYDDTAEEFITVVFVFADGTTEPALPYFEDFADDIEDFFFFIEDIYEDWGE